jgi:hypothetical protein
MGVPAFEAVTGCKIARLYHQPQEVIRTPQGVIPALARSAIPNPCGVCLARHKGRPAAPARAFASGTPSTGVHCRAMDRASPKPGQSIIELALQRQALMLVVDLLERAADSRAADA